MHLRTRLPLTSHALLATVEGHTTFIRCARIVAVSDHDGELRVSAIAMEGSFMLPGGDWETEVTNITVDLALGIWDDKERRRAKSALERWNADADTQVDVLGWSDPVNGVLIVNHERDEAVASGPAAPIGSYSRLTKS